MSKLLPPIIFIYFLNNNTTKIHITKIVEAIVKNTNKVFPAAVVLNGDFGITDVAMDMKCRIGKDGIADVIDPDFTDEQLAELKETETRVKIMEAAIGLL